MIEKGSFGKHNRQFHPKPQVCPDSSGQPLGFNSTLVAFLAYITCVILGLIILIFEYQIYKIHKQKIMSEIEKKRIEDEVQSNIMENFQNIQGRLEIRGRFKLGAEMDRHDNLHDTQHTHALPGFTTCRCARRGLERATCGVE